MAAVYEHPIDVPALAIDANGHVNNVQYVQWMQDAAVAHFTEAGGTPIMQAHAATWVVRSHQIEYLRPAVADDRILVRTWVEDFRRVMSLRRYEFLRAADRTMLAKGQTEWVFIDTATGRPKSIPEELRALFAAT
jgi:acyl-CoA thioester hydrolase